MQSKNGVWGDSPIKGDSPQEPNHTAAFLALQYEARSKSNRGNGEGVYYVLDRAVVR